MKSLGRELRELRYSLMDKEDLLWLPLWNDLAAQLYDPLIFIMERDVLEELQEELL